MRIGSLFSGGCGGLELGLEHALNGDTVWQVEFNAAARGNLARHWPNADRTVVDVREAGLHNLERVDLVCGGFPCTDISPAGKREGIDGEESGLWREYARILRELRPRYVVVENSAALTVRGLGRVLGDLASLGYDAEWARIGAVDVGAPHRRWRCFIVAWLPDTDSERRQGQHRQGVPAGPIVGVLRDVSDPRADRCDAPSPSGEQVRAGGHTARLGLELGREDWLPEPSFSRVAYGFPAVLDGHTWTREALRQLGNAVVPQVAYQVGLWLLRIADREGLT